MIEKQLASQEARKGDRAPPSGLYKTGHVSF